MYQFIPHIDRKLTKIQQIVNAVTLDIERGILERDSRLPSINEFSEKYGVARDTIEKAYSKLKKEGYITSVAGKGYFVLGKKDKRLKVLLIFNKLSSYKRMVYDSILLGLGKNAKVDLQIHHYNPLLLNEIVEANKDGYHYFVIMPHFFHNADKRKYLKILQKIPSNKLLLLDKDVPELQGDCMAVYQHFKQDIYDALTSANDLLNKYNRLVLVFSKYSNHPLEITEGVKQFCNENSKDFIVVDNAIDEEIRPGSVYIVTSESDLANVIKKVRTTGLVAGREVGIISFNETVLKELLDITVITSDFDAMGRTAAHLILNKTFERVRNSFVMIRRGSL